MQLYRRKPIQAVEAPGLLAAPIRFHEPEAVDRLVGGQPSAMRRSLMGAAYGPRW